MNFPGPSRAFASRLSLAIRSSIALGVAPVFDCVRKFDKDPDGKNTVVERGHNTWKELGERYGIIRFCRTVD